MIYSKWIDNSNISLDDLINNIKVNKQNHIREIDAFDNTPLNYEVDFVYEENQFTIINGKDIYFLLIKIIIIKVWGFNFIPK